MLILVGPSASGKTEIANILIEKYQLEKIVTYTTRPQRAGEIDKISYNFVSLEEFEKLKNENQFIETVIYNNYHYGTRKSNFNDNKIIILEPKGLQIFINEINYCVSFVLIVEEKIRLLRMLNRNDNIEDAQIRILNDRVSFKNIEKFDNIDYHICNDAGTSLEELAEKIYELYLYKMRRKKMQVLIETSARHVHVTEEAFKVLFGENKSLTLKKNLSQPGQYACEERVTIVGPKKNLAGVSILGPTRKETQVELSATDCRSIGLDVCIRESGDLKGSPGCTIIGPCGEVVINEGVIVAKRHIHMTKKDASDLGLEDKQIVSVKVDNDVRSIIYGDVVVRVRDDFALAMHIDTDESNAGFIGVNVCGEIIK